MLRRRICGKDGVIAIASEAAQQLRFLDEADNPIKLYEHVVLVKSLGREGYELRTIGFFGINRIKLFFELIL